MNLPNKITLSRILIVPFFMLFILPITSIPLLDNFKQFMDIYGKYIAVVIFIIASSTDGIDGYIARKRKQITKLGQFLDPIADKLLVTAALLALVQRNELSAWAAMIIIGRDIIVTGLRMVAAGEGIVIAASKWGKIKTVTQMIAIVMSLLDNYPFILITDYPIDNAIMIIAVVVTIYSGYDYMVRNIKVLDKK